MRLSARTDFPNHGKTHANDNDFVNGTHLVIMGLRLVTERSRDGRLVNGLWVVV